MPPPLRACPVLATRERCACFVTTIATGRGWTGDEIVLADLASLDLDAAAIEAGYGRPAAAPRSPAATVVLVGQEQAQPEGRARQASPRIFG